jgi:hypothetical protein
VNDLIRLAPTILGFLGGPAGGLAGAGLQWLAGKLGAKTETVGAIKEALQGFGPADTIRLRELDVEFQKFCIENEIKVDLAQIEVNLQDAKSEKWWQNGWRPAVGWVCVTILALTYIPKALVLTAFWGYQAYLTFAHPEVKLPEMPAFPDLGLTDVLGLLGTLLGAGWMAKLRTDEKMKRGIANA